jgi:hypothetical protein
MHLHVRRSTHAISSDQVMPLGVIGHVLSKFQLEHWEVLKVFLKRYGIWIGLTYGLRRWCAGATNQSLRQMAAKVVIVTVRPLK